MSRVVPSSPAAARALLWALSFSAGCGHSRTGAEPPTDAQVADVADAAPDADPDATPTVDARRPAPDAALPDARPAAPDLAGANDASPLADAQLPPDAAPTDDTPLVISEVMSDNEDTLRSAAGGTPDWVELYNPGPGEVALAGWTLSDPEATLVFGPNTLPPGEFLLVWASGDGPGVIAGELHAPFRLSAEGESLRLRRPDGSTADAVDVPPLGPDESWGRSEPVDTRPLVDPNTPPVGRVRPPDGFEAPAFDDSGWALTPLPAGFDRGVAPGAPVNAALGGVARQSTDGYGRTGGEAVDGDPLTFSHTNDADLAPWLEVDLGAPHLLESVTLLNRGDCCPERLHALTVALFNDADDAPEWQSEVVAPVPAEGTPVDPGLQLFVPVDPPRIATRVRVSKQAVPGYEWLSLAEVVVTGRAVAPYAADLVSVVEDAPLGLRGRFDLPASPTRLVGTARFDDRATLFLDGLPVHILGEPGTPHDAFAPARLRLPGSSLAPGEHTWAARVDTEADADLFFDLSLAAETITVGGPAYFRTATPGEPNGEGFVGLLAPPVAEPPGGLYADDVAVSLRGGVPGATLIYTLDGTPPAPGHGIEVSSAPDAPTGPEAALAVPDTTLLRAIVVAPGYAPSAVATHSYLRLDRVVRQPAQPAGFPELWSLPGAEPVPADYEMDPQIVDPDPEAMVQALRSLPTLSIVTAPEALFGPRGLYLNTTERGAEWERPASVEWLLPDGTRGFAETCGLRIHGYGWRPHSSTPKHAFRLEFAREYGHPKLEYPLFPDSPVTRFDSIVLRAGGSKTWLDFRDPAQGQYLHDAFARDTARDMGKVDGHAAFAHLYLNGLYWGLYNLVERPEADFGAESFGGDPEEYDAINRRTVTNEAIDGNLEAYDDLLVRADADVSTPEGLAAVEALLDLDDLIDYMLIHQYTTNRDGPCCFSQNNMRGLRRRAPEGRFRFFVWDMEYSLWSADDATNVDIDVPGAISHVYTRLRLNETFRARYAARAARHLAPDGALSPEAAAARYEARAAEIHEALLAESARWGDHTRAEPYTRDVEWQAEFTRLMTEYFPNRTARLIEQLRAAGLY